MKKIYTVVIILLLTQAKAQVTLVSQSNPTCPGACNGTIVIQMTGGITPYTIVVTSGSGCTVPQHTTSANTFTLTNICGCSTMYDVTVLDAGSNIVGNTGVSIADPPPIVIHSTITNITCNGQCNGSICINPIGGTAPYVYTWSPSGITTPCSYNLCAGSYTACVEDASGCTTCTVTTITQPAPLVVGFNYGLVSCCNAAGFMDTTHTASGDSVVAWNWTFSAGCYPLTANTQNPSVALAFGTNTVCLTVTTAKGCTDSTCNTVYEPTMSVNDIKGLSSNILIYPNPAKDLLNIEGLVLNQTDEINVCDVLGNTVKQFNTRTSVLKIDVSDVAKGIYFIRTKQGTQKFIKQ